VSQMNIPNATAHRATGPLQAVIAREVRLEKIKAAYDPNQAIVASDPVWPARH